MPLFALHRTSPASIAVLVGAISSFAAPVAIAAPSTELQVGGAVARPTTYDLAALPALPATVQTVGFAAGGAPQAHTCTYTSLWGVVSAARTVVGPAKNAELDRYVLVTGAGGTGPSSRSATSIRPSTIDPTCSRTPRRARAAAAPCRWRATASLASPHPATRRVATRR